MDQIFNELSVNGGYMNSHLAKDGFERVLNLSVQMTKLGFGSTIRTTRDFSQRNLTDNFSIHNWATDRSMGCDHDLQRHMMTLMTKSPYIEDFITKHEEHDDFVEFKYEGENVLGLGLAYLWQTFVLSLDCNERFCDKYVKFKVTAFSDDAEYNEIIEVLSLSTTEQLNRLVQRCINI
jgi:hypothetical protein